MAIEYKRNAKGIIECFKDDEYIGVVVTTCSNPSLEEELFAENKRVKELREKGKRAEPKEW